ncbi:MAG: DUF3786 domain-containing protein [Omnitrophica bacterium]|nr:DUF3786 domain-containing protein [Candidatus Omnitrophota bacterium]
MKYVAAISKAWSELEQSDSQRKYSLRFLADTYSIDSENKSVFSASCGVPAKPYYSILLLHYLVRKLKGLPRIKGEWVSFKELGGEVYYPTFKKRVIDTIVRKYQDKPEALLQLSERFPAKRAQLAEVSIVIEVLERVPILISFWRADEEFGAQANVLFDQSISQIFCTEDIVVLAEILAHSI